MLERDEARTNQKADLRVAQLAEGLYLLQATVGTATYSGKVVLK